MKKIVIASLLLVSNLTAFAGGTDFTIVEDADQYVDTDASGNINKIYAEPQKLWAGEETYITLSMTNTMEVVGFSFDVELPEGLTFALNDKGRAIVEWCGGRQDDHSLSSRLQPDGKLTVTSLSITGRPFAGNEGELLRIKLDVAEEVVGTTVPIVLHDIELGDLNAQFSRVERYEVMCDVKAPMPGDADGDLEVTESDVIDLSQYLLNDTPPEEWEAHNADANADGSIDVADIIWILRSINSEKQ